MDNSIEIHIAAPEDADILADISKRAFDSDIEVGAPGPGGPPGYDSVEEHRRDAENERLDYIKVLYEGKIVGGLRVWRVGPGHRYIYGVFVDPDYHKHGIGTKSFEMVKAKYPDAKIWTLDTPEWNVRTKAFYEKIGFIQKGVLRWEPEFELRYYELITDDSYELGNTVIRDLEDGMKKVIVEGTIDDFNEPQEVVSRKDSKTHQVMDTVLSDDTGSVKLVLWNEHIRQVKPGERVRIMPGYTNSFRGELQLNVSKWGQIIILQ